MDQALDGLYLLQSSSLPPISSSLDDFLSQNKLKAFTFASSKQNLYSLWHSRLGHPVDLKIQSLSYFLPFLQHCDNKHCTVCSLAKQKRLSFPFDDKQCASNIDLVHMDVWGPFSTRTLDGHKYLSIF